MHRVVTLHGGPLAPGERSFTVETAGWAAGVYVARMWSDGQETHARFTVTR